MHGRLKVKTTEQQKAEKKAQRLEKLKTYKTAMATILELREEAGKDGHPALLKMTAAVLMANPDITTLWNVRKDVLAAVLPGLDDDRNREAIKAELDLTVQCLMANPKSYGAWHHRCWANLCRRNPDGWDKELALCNKYLSLDERNFHCWDYRRFVVRQAGIPADVELDYSMDRINANFSNYSAWHYRSTLLPVTSEEIRRQELDLVVNAAFTDPDDSSAWFYHKWLLGRRERRTRPTAAKHSSAEQKLVVAFSRPVSLADFAVKTRDSALVDLDPTTWHSANSSKFDTLWTCQPFTWVQGQVRVELVGSGTHLDVRLDGITDGWDNSNELDISTRDVLGSELENCTELLGLEPDSKWTLYTRVLIMKALDAGRYHQEIIGGFDRLCEIDKKRTGYYMDQKSKAIVDNKLRLAYATGNFSLDLSGLGLTALYFKELLFPMVNVDLTGNNIRGSLSHLKPYLMSCESFKLDEES